MDYKNEYKTFFYAGVLTFGIALLIKFRREKSLSLRNASKKFDSIDEEALDRREHFSQLSIDPRKHALVSSRSMPACLLCGPLGSGKTTILRWLLRELKEHADFQCGVIVNDFADLGVDVERISEDKTTETTLAFSGSCCCCASSSSASSLENTLESLLGTLTKRANVDCVLVEASGLSEAASARAQLSNLTQLDNMIGVLDASSFPPQGWTQPDIESFARSCDLIVLNKSDVCSEKEISSAMALLKKFGASKLVATSQGKLSLTSAFDLEVDMSALGELGTSVAERKASTRYRLKANATHANRFEPRNSLVIRSHHLQDTAWTVRERSDIRIASLAQVQDAVVKWFQSSTLMRAKGKLSLKSCNRSFEFQYSGRCRLQMSALLSSPVRTNRLALVSSNQDDFRVVDELFNGADEYSLDDNALEQQKNLTWILEKDTRVSVVRSDDPHALKFSVTCLKKFGFSELDLEAKFGVYLADVNMDFHSRVNSAVGPLLVAFDGSYCHVSLGNYVTYMDAFAILNEALEKTVSAKFAVVRRYCRCEN